MTNYVSSKAQVRGFIEEDVVILGATVIDTGTLIGKGVMVGYPVEKTLRSLIVRPSFDIKNYDVISRGAKIGKNCIIRSGTVIYETSKIGDKVRTGHNVLIREESNIGEETLIGSSTKLDGSVKIGKRVQIQSNVYLPHLTVIKDDVFIAPNVCFTNDTYPRSKRLVGVLVENDVIIGANATLIAGVKIGKEAVIGAGAVVTQDVSPSSVVFGNPARIHMMRREYDKKREAWEKKIDN